MKPPAGPAIVFAFAVSGVLLWPAGSFVRADDVEGEAVGWYDQDLNYHPGSPPSMSGSSPTYPTYEPPPSYPDTYVPSGPTRAEIAAQQQRDALFNANERGNRYAEKGDYANAVAAYEEALRNGEDPQVRKNLEYAQQQLQWQQSRQAEEAAQTARYRQQDAAAGSAMRQTIQNRLIPTLRGLGTQVDFDNRSGSPVGATAPTTSAPGTMAPAPVVDSSVVDLRDAKTLTVDPSKVAGRPAAQPLEFMAVSSAAPPPDVSIFSTSEFSAVAGFLTGLSYDRDALLKVPPEKLSAFINQIQANPIARKNWNDAILQRALEAADREGRPSSLVTLEILSRDPKLHERVEAVRDRVRNDELNAMSRARGRTPEEFQHAVREAHERAEQELLREAQRLRRQTSLDVDAEVRKLRQDYLQRR